MEGMFSYTYTRSVCCIEWLFWYEGNVFVCGVCCMGVVVVVWLLCYMRESG